MANADHLEMLRAGVDTWNQWRKRHSRGPRRIFPNLSGADLDGMNLRRCDLSHVNLWGAQLRKADLRGANLYAAQMREANLSGADLSGAQIKFAVLSRADLSGAVLRGADLRGASLRRAVLRRTDLAGAGLRHASLAEADVQDAILRGCEVYGAGIWGLKGKPADESALVIQASEQPPAITADDLESAQFLYVLMDNPKIADVIDTVSKRTVLILGRFTRARKPVLDKLKELLLARNFVPLLFDFAKPKARDLTETIGSLAHLSCFVIADVTAAKSIPQELSFIVPYLPSVPVVPIIQSGKPVYGMFEHFQRYPWVLDSVAYRDLRQLESIFEERVLVAGYREAMRARGVRNVQLPKLPKRTPSAKKPAASRGAGRQTRKRP